MVAHTCVPSSWQLVEASLSYLDIPSLKNNKTAKKKKRKTEYAKFKVLRPYVNDIKMVLTQYSNFLLVLYSFLK